MNNFPRLIGINPQKNDAMLKPIEHFVPAEKNILSTVFHSSTY